MRGDNASLIRVKQIPHYGDILFHKAHLDPRTQDHLAKFSAVLMELEREIIEYEKRINVTDFTTIDETFETLVNKMIKDYL